MHTPASTSTAHAPSTERPVCAPLPASPHDFHARLVTTHLCTFALSWMFESLKALAVADHSSSETPPFIPAAGSALTVLYFSYLTLSHGRAFSSAIFSAPTISPFM